MSSFEYLSSEEEEVEGRSTSNSSGVSSLSEVKMKQRRGRKEPIAPGERNPLLSLNLTALALFGLWPFQNEAFLANERLRRLHHRLGLFVYCVFFVFLVSEYIELAMVWGDLEAMTTNMSVSCLYTVGVMKIYAFFGDARRRKLERLVAGVARVERAIAARDEHAAAMRAYVARARRVTYFFWSLTASTIAVFFVIPPIEYRYSSAYRVADANGTERWTRERPMIFSSWFPFDRFAFPRNYAVAYAYQMLMGAVGASYQAIWDMYVVAMMIHSIGQLQILQKTLTDSTRTSSSVLESDCIRKDVKLRWKNVMGAKEVYDQIKHRRLVDCVNHHRYIIDYTRTLNEILRPVMMLYFMVCSLMLCAIGFQASLYGFSIRLCFMVEYLIAMMIQLFLFYWHGNEVVYESQKLLNASYNCEWYKESEKFKKNLWILREGMKLPIRFTVGPFYTMYLPTFLGILRASYSYFALLRQVQEGDS